MEITGHSLVDIDIDMCGVRVRIPSKDHAIQAPRTEKSVIDLIKERIVSIGSQRDQSIDDQLSSIRRVTVGNR
jgi:hypothetical protein